MVTIAGNPVLSTPDGRGLARAFDGLDFMVAIDIYLNETTRHADVILPPTSALERDQYDLVFHGFAVRNTARFTPAVFAKPDDAQHDWEIFGELAERLQSRLGAGLKDRLATKARFAPSPATIITGLLKTGGRTTMRALRKRPEGVDLGPLRPTMPERLQTDDQRIDLTPELLVADLDRVAEALDGTPAVASGELLLIGRRHQRDCNSWLHNTERLTRGRAPAPPAHAPQGPRRARPRGRRGRPGDLTGRRRRRPGERGRRRDARRRVAPARLRPPGRPAPGCATPRPSQASRSTTSPTPSGWTSAGTPR